MIWIIFALLVLLAGVIYFIRGAKGKDVEFDDNYREWLKREGIIK